MLMGLSIESHGQEQEYSRTISLSTWIEEMVSCEKENYRLNDAEIIYDPEKHPDDNLFISWSERDSLNSILASKKLTVNANVSLKNCKFLDDLIIFLGFIEFKGSIEFWECKNLWASVKKCEFNNFEIHNSDFKYGIYFGDCVFHNSAQIINSKAEEFYFKNCRFVPLPNREENDLFFFLAGSNIETLVLRSCSIEFGENMMPSSFKISSSQLNTIILRDIDFTNAIADFSDSEVDKAFIVRNCEFSLPIGFENFSFPEKGMRFEWELLKGNKIGLWNEYDEQPYTAASDSQLADFYNFNELLSIYNNLYTIYKTRGERESANGCYIEMKDIETRRLKHLHQNNPNVTNFFKLRLNQFLKYFCEYGTSPVRSLIISMYVILIFACFYFFFYSEWDRINRSFLIAKSKKLLTYFQSEQKMEDFYSDEHKEELESYQSFKKQIHESAGKVPFFMKFLMKPLYRLSLIRHKVISWLYRRTEILSGKWEDLKGGRKMFVGSIVGVSLTVYLVYLVLIRSLNSLFLSINTFSTLGFGDIPVKGISRYVAILEGFLGWFLLSIFSVSLISQILQN